MSTLSNLIVLTRFMLPSLYVYLKYHLSLVSFPLFSQISQTFFRECVVTQGPSALWPGGWGADCDS